MVAPTCPFEPIADKLTLDDIDRSLLRQILSIQRWPRVAEFFDQLYLIGELDFVEVIAICRGTPPRDVKFRLAHNGRLARSGSIIVDAAGQGCAVRW
ncbi:MAG: hypothetical protein ABI832_24450, partial [bacterium]